MEKERDEPDSSEIAQRILVVVVQVFVEAVEIRIIVESWEGAALSVGRVNARFDCGLRAGFVAVDFVW